MSETTFRNAKNGDRVYSPLFRIKNPEDKTNAIINYVHTEDFMVEIKPDIASTYFTVMQFMFDGTYTRGGGQCLFWENPIKEIPVRPKRKVKKSGFMAISPSTGDMGVIAVTSCVYDSVATAKGNTTTWGRSTQIIPIEFEMEE